MLYVENGPIEAITPEPGSLYVYVYVLL